MAMGPASLPSLGLVLGPNYRAIADVGSFAFTGQTADLSASGFLGQAENPAPLPSLGLVLTYAAGRSLTADAGAFTFDFAPALSDYAVSSEVGAYVLDGQAAIVKQSRPALVGEAGSFALTGLPASLTGPNQFALDAEPGVYVLAGADIPSGIARSLFCSWATFDATGQDMTPLYGRAVLGETGAFSATGQPAALSRSGGTRKYGRRRSRTIGQIVRRINALF